MNKLLRGLGIVCLVIGLMTGIAVGAPINLGFAWNPNTEADIREYQVFRMLGATPAPATDASVCTVQHPTVTCLNNNIGDFTGSGTLRFYAVARDTAMNQSGPSNIVPYVYDFLAPAPPQIFRIVEILGINSLMFMYQDIVEIG